MKKIKETRCESPFFVEYAGECAAKESFIPPKQ